jgi:polar amino acid transport system substrate-binding protein
MATFGVAIALATAGCGSTAANSTPPAAKPALFQKLPESIQKSGVIKNGSDFNYAPMDYTAPDGTTFTGLDYDLAQAIGEKLGVKVESSNSAFGALIPSLQSHRIDVAIAFATLTQEREKTVDFVQYTKSGTSIMVKKGNPANITSIDSLCGKTVGLLAGAVQVPIAQQQSDKCVAAGQPPVTINQLQKDPEVQLLLRSGRIDADLLDAPAAAYVSKSGDFQVVPGSYGDRPHGIMFLKGNNQLRDVIYTAVQQLMADGTYKKIFEKYGLLDITIDAPKINGSES